MMSVAIAERDFTVSASQGRVWRLVGKVIFSSLPGMQEIEILDENNFRAVLRMKTFLIPLSMKLQGEMADLSPPDSFIVRLALQGPAGLFRINQRVTMALKSVDPGKTAVACKAMVERMSLLFRVLFLGQARRFASATFEAIEKRLQDLA